jgi:hypothetical protein
LAAPADETQRREIEQIAIVLFAAALPLIVGRMILRSETAASARPA